MAKSNRAGVWSPYFLSLLRIVAGALLTSHGLQLTFGLLGGHRVPITTFNGIGGVLEVICGVFFTLGILTRLVAFILSGEMAVAYFRVHAPHGNDPLQNSGELAVLYCFLFLYFVFAGGGAFSVDRARGRSL